jgi:dTDP-glucose 4,6-dehydratase
MRIFITGEKGFIARNLFERSKNFNDIQIIAGDQNTNPDVKIFPMLEHIHSKGELCVHSNNIKKWQKFFELNEIDVVIHNAAFVGTDVVALNSHDSTLTNVQGTYNICRAAKNLDIPVCYIGTTVIYDTAQYQEEEITEKSARGPHTLYGCQKLCSEDIVKSQTNKWMIIRPLFAYGGVGDMNSLIAKTIYGGLNLKTKIDMFLDPDKIKDYMHVNDFCDAVLTAIDQGLWYEDWNVAAETPLKAGEIVDMIQQIMSMDLSEVLRWHPKTDYLGNHRLSSKKFRKASGWSPSIDIATGIAMSMFDIYHAASWYNPLKYLEESETKDIDLTEFY